MKENNNMKKKGFNQNGYVEPADYIPKEVRKKFKLGEFAEEDDEDDDIEEMLELDEIESEGRDLYDEYYKINKNAISYKD